MSELLVILISPFCTQFHCFALNFTFLHWWNCTAHYFGINWHVLSQSDCRNCCLYIIRSEIIGMISKSNERIVRVWFEITSMISDQNCTARSSIATLLGPFWNLTIFEKNNNNKILALVVAKLSSQWLFAFHFPEILLITVIEHWNLIGCFVLLSHSHWERKWCDLEQKMVRFVTTESQSGCKDNQWFQNGFNKRWYSDQPMYICICWLFIRSEPWYSD